MHLGVHMDVIRDIRFVSIFFFLFSFISSNKRAFACVYRSIYSLDCWLLAVLVTRC